MYDLCQYKYCGPKEYGYSTEVSIDGRVASLIEQLYTSKRLNKSAIAETLTWIVYEIFPDNDTVFHPEDITLVYHDDFAKTFSHWIDCIDDATGYLNYHRLLMKHTDVEPKRIAVFQDIFSAVQALEVQLTSSSHFDESVLSGALAFLAKRYGVEHDEVLCTSSNVARK